MIKPNWTSIILLILVVILTILFLQSKCSEPETKKDYSKEYQQLMSDTTRLGIKRDSLSAVIDSLETIPPKIKKEIVIRDKEIDQNIAKDSSNSIVEYRRSLQDNNYLPDGTIYPTYREIGLGAKLMAKVPKLELTINHYEKEYIPTLKADIKNYSFLYQSSQDLNKIKDAENKDLFNQLEDERSWLNSNYLWYGLGVVSAVAIIFVAGLAK